MTGSTKLAAAVIAAAALLAGCQPKAQPGVEITSSGTHTYSIYVQRAGKPRALFVKLGKNDGFQYSSDVIRQGKCEDAELVAIRDDGRSFETGPPLCNGQMFALTG